ncbi:homocysteine S-methyltransferase [Spirochaetia bacterium]|nr:homocysteine S-methyltransferase [Spirochaetia bacterium]
MLADGAVGTELMKLGLAPGESTAAWNLSNPDSVRQVASAYAALGSEMVLTNTFGANRFQLERYGLVPKVREINRTGAELVREASGGKALVSGCLGPSGKLLVMKEISEADLYESFAEQVEAQKEGGADLFTVMTMTDAGEMAVAVKAAAASGLPVIASMTYEYHNGQYHTIMGNTPEEAVKTAINAGACAIGANCGGGLDTYVGLAPVLRALTELPVYIKGNAGLPELVQGKAVYRMSPEDFVSYAPELLAKGVTIIGGCCGTGPEYIKLLKTAVDTWNSKF